MRMHDIEKLKTLTKTWVIQHSDKFSSLKSLAKHITWEDWIKGLCLNFSLKLDLVLEDFWACPFLFAQRSKGMWPLSQCAERHKLHTRGIPIEGPACVCWWQQLCWRSNCADGVQLFWLMVSTRDTISLVGIVSDFARRKTILLMTLLQPLVASKAVKTTQNACSHVHVASQVGRWSWSS